MNWEAFFKDVGGTAAAVFAVAWFARALFTSKLSRDLEKARDKLSKDAWRYQKSWAERERFFATILTGLYKLERALGDCADCFMEPGSEHDQSIDRSASFVRLRERCDLAIEVIHENMGSASLHLPDKDYQSLEKLFSELWIAGNESVCTAEYVRDAHTAVAKIRREIRLSAKEALSLETN